MYWAQALAQQTEDKALQAHFAPIAKALEAQEKTIVDELNSRSRQASRHWWILFCRAGEV
jgi:monomeric isocitrate dehydrogenase